MRILFTTFFILIFCSIGAQEVNVSPDEALNLFQQGKYEEALPMYEELIQKYDKEPKYNYYYGVCLVKQRQNNSEALRRLKFVLSKRLNRDVHFYLGKAYQNAYEFEAAIKEFESFLKYAKNNDERKARAEQAIEDCENGESLITKHFNIKVIKKDTIDRDVMLNSYNLPQEAGTLAKNKSFFKTGVPPENIMYRTEKGDEVYFVLEESDTTAHDIYKMEQLLGRGSGSKNLGEPVKSDYDESFPVLMVDGSTLFFASDRPGGMGGYDIYRSTFDPDDDTFSEPENLGPPFNSPADDFLFAADPFSERAWFTTNRGTEPGKVVVVKLVWDDNVLKNLTENVDQIKKIAALPLAQGSMWTQPENKEPDHSAQKENRVEQFRFAINDTLIYTRYEHFQSKAARAEFKRGQAMDIKKDSLEQIMRNKRQQYGQSYKQEELSRLMEEILELEKKVYGHDDQMKRHYIRARQIETEKIDQQINQGAYRGIPQPPGNNEMDNKYSASSLIPENFTFYTDEEFETRKEKLSGMYKKFFSTSQANILHRTDSMYTWAKILKLEASRLLEESVENPEDNESVIQRLRKLDSIRNEVNEISETRQTTQKSKEINKQAHDLYHYALDKKYSIYRPTLQQLTKQPGKDNLENVSQKANSYFEEANNQLEKRSRFDPEHYEQLGGLKRQAIEMIENELLAYTGDAPQTSRPETTNRRNDTGKVQNNYQTIQSNRNRSAETSFSRKNEEPDNIVKSAFGINRSESIESENQNKSQPVFKIQIGVFKNTPNTDALAPLPEISKKKIPGREVTRYFSGKWETYQEAQNHLEEVRKNGFSSAFIVAFLNGEQIPLSEAGK